MPTGLTLTIAKILLNSTTPYSKGHDALTSGSAKKLREKVGSNLYPARILKKMLLYSQKLFSIKSTPTL
jgi:hypothetical protein